MTSDRIGRYSILGEIAAGAQGAVFRAHDATTGRIVALKVLHRELASDDTYVERFRREAKLAASINHPNIVEIYEVGEDNRRHFIAVEYLPESLSGLIEAGPVPIDLAALYSAQLADGLAAAHTAGVIHRDIKPQNVLIGADGSAKITDFGIARGEHMATMTSTGVMMGTPYYMSPEQASGERADGRSDIYSLGCVIHQMLTGQVPFQAATPLAVLRQHIDEPPPPVRDVRKDTPKAFADVVTRCLEKDPEKRFQTAAEVAAAVRASMPSISTGTIQTAAANAAKLAAARSVSEPPGGSKTGAGGLPKWIWAIAALVIVGIGAAVLSSTMGSGGTEISASPPESAIDGGGGGGSEPALTSGREGNAGEGSGEVNPGGEPQGEPTANAAATVQAERATDRLKATETALLEATKMAGEQVVTTEMATATPSPDQPVVTEVPKPRRFETQIFAKDLPGNPFGIAFDGEHIWVTMPQAMHEGSEGMGTVARMSQNGDILGIYEVGNEPLSVVAARGNAWITQYGADQVINLAPDGETIGTYPTDDGPVGIGFDGQLIWIANADAGTVTLLTLDGDLVDSFVVGGSPTTLEFDGEHMWVANTGDQWVAKMSSDGAVLNRVDLDGEPAGMAFDGDHMWVAVNSNARLLKIDDTGWVVLDVATRDQPVGLGFDGSSIWVAHENDDLMRFNMSGDPIGKVEMPGATLLAFDGEYMWATPNVPEPSVAKVGPISLVPFYFEPVTTAVRLSQPSGSDAEDQPAPSAVTGPTPTEPEVFTIDTTTGLSRPTSVVSTGEHIWVTNYGDDTVHKLDLNGNLVERYEGFAGPLDILFDGEHIWVLNEQSTDISKLSLNGEQLGRFGAHLAPQVMALARNKIWVATSQIIGGSEEFGVFGISKDGSTGDWISGTEKLTDPINSLEFDGDVMWLAAANLGVLERINISGSGRPASTLAPIEIGGRTDGLVYDGFDIFVTDYESSSVKRLTSSGITFAIYKAGDGARSIVYDGQDLWIANERSKTVMRMSYNGDIMSEFEMPEIPQNMYFDGKNIWVTHLDANAVTRIGPVRLAPETGRISPEPRDSEEPEQRATVTPIPEVATSPCIFDGLDTTVVSDTQWAGKLLSDASTGATANAIEAFFIVEPNVDSWQCEVSGLFTMFPPMMGSGPLNGFLSGGDGTAVGIEFVIPAATNDVSTNLDFKGSINTSTGVIEGEYTTQEGDHGSWTVSPIDLESAPVIPNTPVPTQTPLPIATATPLPASVKVTGGEDIKSTVGRRVFLTDAQAASSFSGDFIEIEVNWGDGSSWEDVGSIVNSGKIFANHVYEQTGNFEVTVLARSESGTESSATVNISIGLAPTPTASPTPQRESSFINVSAGDNGTRKVGEFVRLENAWGQSSQEGELLAATVDWGDGTETEPAVIVQQSGEIDAMHIYAFPGMFTITVKVMNDFGDEGMSQTSMRIEPSS